MPTFEEIDARNGSTYKPPAAQPARVDATGRPFIDALADQMGIYPDATSASNQSPAPSSPPSTYDSRWNLGGETDASAVANRTSTPAATPSTTTSGTSNGTVRINPTTGLFEFVGGGATGSTAPAYSAGTSGSSGSTAGSGGLISGTPSGSYAPNTNRQVDARNETIEGRINGLLSADNPVMQQAGNRAMQQFQGRGLLNSSMAIQAANEAMVSRAIEIAGPDAATYNKTGLANQSEANQFARAEQTHGYNLETDATRHGYDMETDATRQGYEQANLDKKQGFALETQNIDNANLTTREREGRAADSARIYSEGVGTIEREGAIAIDNINKSDMTPGQKTAAIEQRRILTTQNLDAWNAASKSLPGWSDEWAVIPVTTPAGSTTPAATTAPADGSSNPGLLTLGG